MYNKTTSVVESTTRHGPDSELCLALDDVALGERHRAEAEPAAAAPAVARRDHVLGAHRAHQLVGVDVVRHLVLLGVDQAVHGGGRTQHEAVQPVQQLLNHRRVHA